MQAEKEYRKRCSLTDLFAKLKLHSMEDSSVEASMGPENSRTPRLAHYPHRTIHEAEPNLVPQAPPLLQTQYSVVKGLSKQSVLAPLSKSFNCNFSTRCHLIVADVYKLVGTRFFLNTKKSLFVPTILSFLFLLLLTHNSYVL